MNGRFAAWLADQLRARDLDGVAEAARAIGVSQSMVSNYLNGKQVPGRKSIKKIAVWAKVPESTVLALLPDDTSGDLLRTAGRSGVIMSPTATIRIDDPRLLGHFYGFLSRWERMTEEERDSLTQDDVDIPDPEADRGEGDARGGGGSPRGPA